MGLNEYDLCVEERKKMRETNESRVGGGERGRERRRESWNL